jgi:hypothetical protein
MGKSTTNGGLSSKPCLNTGGYIHVYPISHESHYITIKSHETRGILPHQNKLQALGLTSPWLPPFSMATAKWPSVLRQLYQMSSQVDAAAWRAGRSAKSRKIFGIPCNSPKGGTMKAYFQKVINYLSFVG